MGKKSRIKSLAKIISNIAIHKILVNHTNKPESINFLGSEIAEYRNIAFNVSQEFNWNNQDINEIKINTIKLLNKIMQKKYPDVTYNKSEAEKLIQEIINEIT